MQGNVKIQTETKKKVEIVEQKTSVASTTVKSSVLSEINDQEKRRTNLIVHNLSESNSEEGAVRRDHNLGQLCMLFQQLGFSENDCKVNVTSLRRLGKRYHDSHLV